MIDFKEIEIKDKERIDLLLKATDYNSTDYCFTTLYIWRAFFKIKIGYCGNFLVIKFGPSIFNHYTPSYLFPAGMPIHGESISFGADVVNDISRNLQISEKTHTEEMIKEVIDELIFDAHHSDVPFVMQYVLKEQKALLEKLYPEKFSFTEDRNNFDYIYNSYDLIFLHGKKFQGKRNHVMRFKELDGWSYEKIDSKNAHECYEMNKEWCRRYGCVYDTLKEDESCAVYCALNNFDKLKLNGGLLRLNGKVIAFTIGEMINSDTFIVHIEKAFSDINGAYPAISAMFLRSVMNNPDFVLPVAQNDISELLEGSKHDFLLNQIGFRYVNREDDAGNEGLRAAKMQYHPAFLLEKYCVKEN